MELIELLEVGTLLSYYKNLLSEKQLVYLVEHIEQDMSLSEIARNHNVSRQAVFDNIKRGIKILNEYEGKIGFYKKECEIESMLQKLKEKSLEENNFEKYKKDSVEEIQKVIDKLF
ncbi:MAG: YlxM family DNA-binding protein [Fusobacteriaceae bacterium]